MVVEVEDFSLVANDFGSKQRCHSSLASCFLPRSGDELQSSGFVPLAFAFDFVIGFIA